MQATTSHEQQARCALLPRLNLSTQERELLSTWNSDARQLPELTQEEEEAAIAVAIPIAISEAKHRKGQRMFSAAYAKKVSQNPTFPTFTAGEFKNVLLDLGNARALDRGWSRPFEIDQANESAVKALSLYFTQDGRFLKLNDRYSFSKGLLLIGPTGCGKTSLMSLCSENQKQSYLQADCVTISNDFTDKNTGGSHVIDHHSRAHKNGYPDRFFGHEYLGLFFDDLGAESNAKHMGNERNVMSEIIQNRYSQLPHYLTHLTSNHTLEELRVMYGARVEERIREMCNVIEFPGSAQSRRI